MRSIYHSKKVEAGLPLADAAVPAAIVVDDPHPMEVGSDVGLAGKELVEPSSQFLSSVAEVLAAWASFERRPVPAFGATVVLDPLRRGVRSGPGGGVVHVREYGLAELLVGVALSQQGAVRLVAAFA